ncbi:MAG: nitroreductase family protein [Arachidicoccus sp.]|nr:nitroreductase family protein [Arachidicoccus sp.]
MNTLEALNWRYATKKMNGKKVDEKTIDEILEAARLAPTSSGLQPFNVILIKSDELKQKIQPIAHGQTQIVDCSHLLVFAAWDNYTEERIKERFNQTRGERGLPDTAMADYENMLLNAYVPREAHINFEHAARQAYIGFGIAILAAANLQVDATPMEGFNNEALDELLGLNKLGLKSVTLLPIGYRDADNDWLVNLKKVRESKEKFVIEID